MQSGDVRTTDYTEEGAKKSFEFVLKDYLDYTVENGTLEQDLMNHGWLYKANCNYINRKIRVKYDKFQKLFVSLPQIKKLEYEQEVSIESPFVIEGSSDGSGSIAVGFVWLDSTR